MRPRRCRSTADVKSAFTPREGRSAHTARRLAMPHFEYTAMKSPESPRRVYDFILVSLLATRRRRLAERSPPPGIFLMRLRALQRCCYSSHTAMSARGRRAASRAALRAAHFRYCRCLLNAAPQQGYRNAENAPAYALEQLADRRSVMQGRQHGAGHGIITLVISRAHDDYGERLAMPA